MNKDSTESKFELDPYSQINECFNDGDNVFIVFNQQMGCAITDWGSSAFYRHRFDSVVDMNHMFAYTNSFNIDLSSWVVSSVTNMVNMFAQATAYTQVLCGNTWIESTASKTSMFNSAGAGAKIGTEICSCSLGKYLTYH